MLWTGWERQGILAALQREAPEFADLGIFDWAGQVADGWKRTAVSML